MHKTAHNAARRNRNQTLPLLHAAISRHCEASGITVLGAQANSTIDVLYDAVGNVTNRTFTGGRVQSLRWDALNRLLSVTDKNGSTTNSLWTATYDPLGRRLQTVHTAATNGTLSALLSTTIDSWYDPEVEFQEVAVSLNGERTWKVHGPDLNGVYGSLMGVGGLEATIRERDGYSVGVINDGLGNCVGTVLNGQFRPATTVVSSYGPLQGFEAPKLSLNVPLAEATLWRSKRIDPTGFYYFGARYLDPLAGKWLSPDPAGHAISLSLYDYCANDPVNCVDPDGRVGKGNNAVYSSDFSSARFYNSYDAYYLGMDRSLAGESLRYDPFVRSRMPITDWPIEGLDGQSFRMMFGNEASAFAEFGVGVATAPVAIPADVAESFRAAGTASVEGSGGEQAFAYTRAGVSVLMATLATYGPARGFAGRSYASFAEADGLFSEVGRQGMAARAGTATQLEFGFVDQLGPRARPIYPPNDGFLGRFDVTIAPGHMLDRFGADAGRYTALEGTAYGARALPPGSQNQPYSVYEVVKPVNAQAGPAAPAFGEPGLGLQFKFDQSIQKLIDQGYLIKK